MDKKLSSILLVSYVAFTLGGCGIFPQSEDPSEDPPVAQSPQASEEEPSEEQPDEVFEEPTATGSTPQLPSTAGLIPSTSPNERKKGIKPGRDNPFAVIPIQPVVRQKTASNGVAEPEKLCQLEEVKQPATTIAQAPGTAAPVSDVSPPPLLDPILPIPNEARGVVVSGVVQLNGTPVAIVKAPNENVARQVTVGASLSNGQVTVKAINVSSQNPYIVLEQYGLEIPRSVGEPAEEAIDPPTLPDGTPQPPASPVITAPEPGGYGTIKNLVLLKVNLTDEKKSNPLIDGTLCNSGFDTLKVSNLELQVEEKATNTVINSMNCPLPSPITLTSGTKAIIDCRVGADDQSQKSELGLRGRAKEDITIRLVDWS
ncbi:MAG: hypothetical protein AB4063_02090 [Crocosphaera sp.]